MDIKRTRAAALVAAFLVLLGVSARADVAATGTFTVELTGGAPPAVSFAGDITFDAGAFTALGSPVNLAADVGSMTFTGNATVDSEPPSATFSLAAQDTSFSFTASGAGACSTTNCVNGTATFNGRFDGSSDPGNALPDGVFTFDGTAYVAFLGTGPGGVFALNAFPSIVTGEGTMVTVASGASTYYDSIRQQQRPFAAEATFDTVTATGGTSFAALSSVPGLPPVGVDVTTALSVFVDVETTAGVSGAIRVCLLYDDADGDGFENVAGQPVAQLRLLHAAAEAFVDVTTTVGGGKVCGTVSGLSPFVIGVGSQSSSTTTIVGGGTTTTTLPLGDCDDPVVCLERALGAPLCVGEQLNPKLAAIVATKLGKARTLLQRAGTVASTKVAKLIAKARKQLDKVGAKADAFVTKKKGPITAGCRDDIRATLDQIGQVLTANPPTGTSGGGGGGVQATIPGYAPFDAGGFFYDETPIYAEGCEPFPGSKECRRLFTFAIPNGSPQTIVQPEAVVPLVTYSEYPDASPSSSADVVLSSTTGTVIEVTGIVNGRLQGRFSGTFRQTHPLSDDSVVIEGTFNVPARKRPF